MTTLFLVVVLVAIATSIPSLHGSSNNAALQISVDTQSGAYYLAYSIGTPPVSVSGNLIAGSDLIWLPCETSDFNLANSSTYSPIACPSSQCGSLPATTCSTNNKTCNYNMTYADGSSTSGDFSTDAAVSFFPSGRFAFGCATKYDDRATPSVGLGRGNSSLVQQLGSTKFSYCLVPFSSQKTTSGELKLGDEAEVSGGISTTLIRNSGSPTFYYARLESVTIESTTIEFNGDILLELGTPMTLLPRAFYESLIGALRASMPRNNFVNGSKFGSDLCYSKITDFPRMSVGFQGGVVEWKAENVFAQLEENVFCVAFGVAAKGADAIYGSYAQTNFFVGFNLDADTVNFKPATCSE